MKNRYLFAVLIVFNLNAAATASSGLAPEEEWNMTYGGPFGVWAHSIQETPDGGYIIMGAVNKISYSGQNSADIIIFKTDAKGRHLWSFTTGGKDNDRPEYIIQTSDGGYLITGSEENFGNSYLKVWLVKINASGGKLWNKKFDTGHLRQYLGGNPSVWSYREVERSIRETPDGGFLLMGRNDDCIECPTGSLHPIDIWLMKIDPEGNEEWSKEIQKADMNACSFLGTPDGGAVLACASNSTVSISRSDKNGIRIWNRTYGNTGGSAIAILKASDGGYLAASSDPFRKKTWTIRTDPDGFEKWRKTFKVEYDAFNFFLETKDGGYLMGTDGWSNGFFSDRFLKVDADGNMMWKKSVTGLMVRSVQETGDGGYLFGGIKKLSSDVFNGYSVARIGPYGDQMWMKTFSNEFGWESFQWGNTAIETRDGGYAILGNTLSTSAAPDIKLIRLKKENGFPVSFTWEPEYPGIDKTVVFKLPMGFDKNNSLLYVWDFGDGSKAQGLSANMTHSFTREGIMTVELQVVENNSILGLSRKNLTVRRSPPPEETRNLTFGEYAGARYAHEPKDGGFIIAGESMSEGMPYSWILKTDTGGKELWNVSFERKGLSSVINTPDGGFAAIGNTLPSGDIWFVKIDSQGKELWNNSFQGQGFDTAGSVTMTADGGFIIAGSYASPDNEHSDAWLVKTYPNGTRQWDRRITGGTGRNMAMGVRQVGDGGYIAVGTMSEQDSTKAGLIRIDLDGNVDWTKTYGMSDLDYGGSVMQAADGGFLVFGTSIHILVNSTYTDAWLIKTDTEGNMQWNKTMFMVNGYAWTDTLSGYPGNSYLFSAVEQERSEEYEHDEVYYKMFVKTDPDGNVLWQKREDGVSAMQQTTDGGYIFVRDDMLIKLGGAKPAEPEQTPEPAITKIANKSELAGFDALFTLCVMLIVVYLHLMKKGS